MICGDILGRLGLMGRQVQAERGHVLVEGADELLGQLLAGDSPFVGALDDLVVHVGEVADVGDLDSRVLQVAVDDVEDDVGPGVADVAESYTVMPQTYIPTLPGSRGRNSSFRPLIVL